MLKNENLIMSKWYDMVGTAVFLIFVFSVPELGVSL